MLEVTAVFEELVEVVLDREASELAAIVGVLGAAAAAGPDGDPPLEGGGGDDGDLRREVADVSVMLELLAVLVWLMEFCWR